MDETLFNQEEITEKLKYLSTSNTQKLEAKGIKFFTKSDTEVVLRYFMLYGKKCLDFFEGMWSFAIYNTDTNKSSTTTFSPSARTTGTIGKIFNRNNMTICCTIVCRWSRTKS